MSDIIESGEIFGYTFLAIFLLLLLWFIIATLKSCIVVGRKTAVIVERWGKFHRRLDEGWYFLLPWERIRPLTWRFFETYTEYGAQAVRTYQRDLPRIDLRESAYDFPNQTIITRDNVEIAVHPMLLWKIVDPVRAVYEVFDLTHAVEKLVQTTLRSIIGDMGLDDTLASREEINRSLLNKLGNVCLNWGVEITAVEVLEIVPVQGEIQKAMHLQISAERRRRAAVVEATGFRKQIKTRAEGECAATIALSKAYQKKIVLRSKGKAESMKKIAEAEAESLSIIAKALSGYGVSAPDYVIGWRYIEAFKELCCSAKSRRIFFPFQTDVIGAARFVGLPSEIPRPLTILSPVRDDRKDPVKAHPDLLTGAM
jgi:regulator of protease activity HflC (stomatin/prohibitin superfamily)